jgi:PAS domain S-box-containing protein
VELALAQRRLREEKRFSDDQLRASERRLRAIIDHSTDGIALVDAGAIIRFASPSVTHILGYQPDEWIGRIAFDFVHPEDLAAIKTLFGEILQQPGCNRVALCRCRHKDESWRWIETGVANYLADPAVQALVCNYRDVTERKSAEQQAHELRLAGRIQQGFLPRNQPAVPGFDIAGVSYPAAVTGGDYFDFIPLGNDTLSLVIGDVSGHGFASTLLMAETHAYLRALALSYQHSGRRCTDTLCQLIALLNQALVTDNAEDHFLSLLFGCINLRTRNFAYVNAGHPPGFILDSSGAVKRWLTSTSLVLGIEAEVDFPTGEPLILQSGDLVVFLTDGILEARAPDGSFFGTDRALKVVRHYRRDSARDIANNIHHAVRAFCQDLPQEDDISVVVTKVDGAPFRQEKAAKTR